MGVSNAASTSTATADTIGVGACTCARVVGAHVGACVQQGTSRKKKRTCESRKPTHALRLYAWRGVCEERPEFLGGGVGGAGRGVGGSGGSVLYKRDISHTPLPLHPTLQAPSGFIGRVDRGSPKHVYDARRSLRAQSTIG